MAEKKSVKKYTGVYYSESKTKKWRDRPDRVYWVAFKDSQNGKLRWERCGWASEGWTPESAQKKRYELVDQDRTGNYKPKQQRKIDQLTLGEFMEKKYLPWVDENRRQPEDDRSRYQNWIAPRFANKTLQEISVLDIEQLKKEMKDAGKADATITHVLAVIRQAYNKATIWDYWNGANPCTRVKFPKLNNARHRFLSREEAESLMTILWTKTPDVAQIATLSLYCGLRLGEIFGLKWGHIDLENELIHVIDTKNSESRIVYITEPVRKVFDNLECKSPDDPVFVTRSGNHIKWLSKSFRIVVDKLGFNKDVTDRRQRVTFHTLRHTYASWAVMAGVPIFVVGKALGHKSSVMTERYSHLTQDSSRKAFEAVADNGIVI